LTGTGGRDVTGRENYGILISEGGVVESSSMGDINLEDTAGNGTDSNDGIRIQGLPTQGVATQVFSEQGNITLTANNITLDQNPQIKGNGTLRLQPLEPKFDITIGGDITDASLALDTNQLNALRNGFREIIIGHDEGSGKITIIGDITFKDPVRLKSPLGNGSIDTKAATLSGVDDATITLQASKNIATGDIFNPGRAIAITSTLGNIDTGTLNTSFPNGNGGQITLNAAHGDIQVSWMDTQGGSNGIGGKVDITAGQFFQATETFSDRNGLLTSISTAGGLGGGDITIKHGGNGVIPFDVGKTTTNSTAGAINSGNFTISNQSFPFTHTEGNIHIITEGNIHIISVPSPPIMGSCPPNCGSNGGGGNGGGTTPKLGNSDDVANIEPPSTTKYEQYLEDEETIPNPGNSNDDIAKIESSFTNEYEQYLGLKETSTLTLAEISQRLSRIEQDTRAKPALIYALFFSKTTPSSTLLSIELSLSINLQAQNSEQLQLLLITSSGKLIHKSVDDAMRASVLQAAKRFRREVANPPGKIDTDSYLEPARQFYQWLVAPLEEDLREEGIENLVFVMDTGLRSLPLAALHNGQGFIIEKYSVGLMPSMSLTDTRYVNVRNAQVLAMGTSEFPHPDLNNLPAIPTEVGVINNLWSGQIFLDNDFTKNTLKYQHSQDNFGILHLGTHGKFRSGKPNKSYIQFWGNERLRLDEVQELRLNYPPVELLVLSACDTALGDEEAELGFAGFAHLAGVKSVLGSLWQVDDVGTLGLMTQFYTELKEAPIKAEALRQAQLAMQRGEVYIKNGKLFAPGYTEGIPLPKKLAGKDPQEFSDPSYWSGFTIVGSPW